MTWTKLGQEFPDDARKLSDAAFRVHVEALCWANKIGADLNVEADDLDHFSFSKDRRAAVAELVTKQWWVTTKDGWYIGEHRREWQLEAVVVEKRREANALRQQRHRLHSVGDHSLCTDRCPEFRNVTRDVSQTRDETRYPDRHGHGTDSASEREVLSSPPRSDEDEMLAEHYAYEATLAEQELGGDAA